MEPVVGMVTVGKVTTTTKQVVADVQTPVIKDVRPAPTVVDVIIDV